MPRLVSVQPVFFCVCVAVVCFDISTSSTAIIDYTFIFIPVNFVSLFLAGIFKRLNKA